LSAIEAYQFFSERGLLVIKYNNHAKNTYQINKVLEIVKSATSLYVVKIEPQIGNFDANIKLLLLLKVLLSKNLLFKRVFIGDYRSPHMRKFFDLLSPQQCFLLDDGRATIDIFENYIKNNKDYKGVGVKSILKSLLYYLEFFFLRIHNVNIERRINLFTCFDLESDSQHIQIINHKFSSLSKLTLHDNKYRNTVYFYGSSLNVIGINNNKEKGYLKHIIKYYQTKKISFIYVPQRYENVNKLKKYEQEFNIEILNPLFPAEVDYLLSKNKPKHIASYFSTVLFTLPKFGSFDSVISFFPPLNEVASNFQDDIALSKTKLVSKVTVVNL
jgi:hypothetical protein